MVLRPVLLMDKKKGDTKVELCDDAMRHTLLRRNMSNMKSPANQRLRMRVLDLLPETVEGTKHEQMTFYE